MSHNPNNDKCVKNSPTSSGNPCTCVSEKPTDKQEKKCKVGHADGMCYCLPDDKQESWRERFEKHDFDPLVHTKDRKTWIEKSQVIDFISRVEQEAYERGYTKAFVDSNEKLVRVAQKARQSTLEEVREIVEGMKGWCSPTMSDYGSWESTGYEKALTTLQEALKNK